MKRKIIIKTVDIMENKNEPRKKCNFNNTCTRIRSRNWA